MKTKLKIKQEEGITLIALVVTIVVLLILAGVSISLVLNNNGVISKAKDAKYSTEKGQAQDEVNLAINYLQIEDATSTLTREDKRKILEDELRKISADSSVSISGLGYKITHKKYDFFVDEDLKISSSGKTFNAVEWDKKAAPEDVFIWKSDDPNNADYGVIIGYKKNVYNYTILRFPSRCTKIEPKYSYDVYKDYEDDETTVRSYTKNILKVEMPDTIKELGYRAFASYYQGFDFSSLQQIDLPEGLETIDSCAFEECKTLKSITIPENVKTIDSMAFSGWTESQTIKCKATKPGDNWDKYWNYNYAYIASKATKISANIIFGYQDVYFDAIEWDKKAAPEDIFIWGSNDSNNSEYGTVVGYTDSVDNYPVLRYPSRCTKLGIDNDKYTFYEKYSEGQIFLGSRDITANIEKIELPSTVTEIGKYAFNGGSSLGYNFENLKEISIPDSVTTIGYYAFGYCDSLKDITIPNNVTNIGGGAFRGCTGLTKITIPNNVTNIGERAFSDCRGLTKITIPNNVTNIGDGAFSGCTGLTEVKLPDGVTNIEYDLFSCCTGLTEVKIPDSVTTIETGAFYGCTGLTEVKIPDSVTTIGSVAFRGCTGLTKITIPNNVTYIGESAFSDCRGLTKITIPNNVKYIEKEAFSGCTGLTDIKIPDSVTYIGVWVFSGCTGLTKITIPNNVKNIGYGAFIGCTGLTDVKIPDSVTNIGEMAFRDVAHITYAGNATGSPWGAKSIGKN